MKITKFSDFSGNGENMHFCCPGLEKLIIPWDVVKVLEAHFEKGVYQRKKLKFRKFHEICTFREKVRFSPKSAILAKIMKIMKMTSRNL